MVPALSERGRGRYSARDVDGGLCCHAVFRRHSRAGAGCGHSGLLDARRCQCPETAGLARRAECRVFHLTVSWWFFCRAVRPGAASLATARGAGARSPGDYRGMAQGAGNAPGGVPGLFYPAAGQRAYGGYSGRNGFGGTDTGDQGSELDSECTGGHRLPDSDSFDGVFLSQGPRAADRLVRQFLARQEAAARADLVGIESAIRQLCPGQGH